MIGTDFPYQQFFPKDAAIIQIDIRGEQLGRRTKVNHGFVGDTKTTLRALLPKLDQNNDDKYLKSSLELYQKARKGLDELATGEPGRKPIHPQYAARVLDELAATDAIFSCDVGTPTIWAARYLKMNGKRRLLGSFNHGSMANALPQAIGAQVSHPGRQVVTLSGDGGLAMLMGDLLSLRQLQLPVKVIVFKNDALAFVELEMKAAGILDFATDLENPDFAKMAEAAGLLGLTAETPDQVRPMITQALKHEGRLWSKSWSTGRNSSCLPRSALSRWPASVFSCSKQFSAVVATKLSIWQRSTYPGKEQQPKSTLYKLSSRKRNPSDALRIRPHDSGCLAPRAVSHCVVQITG
jgi:pyruvate dehydrogenase (quinone)